MTTKRWAQGGQGQETALSEHPNISLLRKIYARDRATFFRMVTDDYVCHTPGSSPVAGRIAEHWENPLDIPAFDAFWK